MNEQINKKQNNNILQIIIIILLVVLIAIGGMILLKDNKKDSSGTDNNVSQNENNSVIESDKIISVSVDDETANKLYDSVKLDCVNFFDEMDTYYLSDNLLVNNLPNSIKMRITALNSKYTQSDQVRIIKESDFIDTYKKIFGKESNYSFESISNGILEKSQDGNILFLTQGACGPYGFASTLSKVEKNETKNEYYIYDKITYYDVDKWIDQNVIDVYSDSNHSNLLFTEKDKFELIWDRLPSYKHIFKSNGDGTYYFYKVEKVK